MNLTLTGWLVLVAVVAAAGPAAGQSLEIGSEVIFSGGPSQPPQTVKVGSNLEIRNIRDSTGPASGPSGSGPHQGPSRGRASGQPGGGTLPGFGFGNSAGQAPQPAMNPRLAPEGEDEAPEPPPKVVDLTGSSPERLDEMLVGSAEVGERMSAARALGKAAPAFKQQALASLRQGLGDSDPRVLTEVVGALHAQRDWLSAAPLAELLNQSDPDLLAAVIAALADLGDRRHVKALKELRDGSGGRLDLAAAKALQGIAGRHRSK